MSEERLRPGVEDWVSEGAWSAKCRPVPPTGEESAVDPIEDWGQPTSAHTHEFFAPTVVNATMSPGVLLALPDSAVNCQGPTAIPSTPGCTLSPPPTGPTEVCDKSAYWVPELVWDTAPLDNGVQPSPLAPDHMNIYWRNEYTNPQLDSPFPSDFAMVAGDAMASEPQNFWIVNWQCVVPQSPNGFQTPGRYSPVIPSSCEIPQGEDCPDSPTDCYPVDLRLVVTFPECVMLAPQDSQGMETPSQAYYNIVTSPTPAPPDPQDPSSYQNCSAGYLQIPNIQIDPHWVVNRAPNSAFVPESTVTSPPLQSGQTPQVYLDFDLSGLLLSSDLVMDRSLGATVTPGTTSHADYENGYDQANIDGLIKECFESKPNKGGMNCGAI